MSPLARRAPLTSTLPRSAVSASVLALFQASGASTFRSPWVLVSSTWVVARFFARVSVRRFGALRAVLLAMSSSFARTFQVPVLPWAARVSTSAASCTSTRAPRFSTWPPLPWPEALASCRPATWTVPLPPSRTMRPSLFCRVRASITPWLLTTVLSRLSALRAVISTWPPSALIRPPLCARASTAPAFTCRLSRPLPSKLRLTSWPAPRATLPRRAWITPLLSTRAPSRATLPPSPALRLPALLTLALELPLKR
ncbi:hypothetical protein FQZ97_815270 [compost metagenome]